MLFYVDQLIYVVSVRTSDTKGVNEKLCEKAAMNDFLKAAGRQPV